LLFFTVCSGVDEDVGCSSKIMKSSQHKAVKTARNETLPTTQ